jgi:hypothetical protein
MAHVERQAELEGVREQVRMVLGTAPTPFVNPRILLVATDDKGTRRFVEVAV